MKSRKTTNFEFLEEISPELYGLAVKMEEDLLITPVSMLTYATRFLEYILHDIADECNYDVNTKDGFVDKVNQLIRSDYLSNSLHNNLPQLLIDAYNERSYSIHSHKIEESLKNDEIIAFRLNETLFYIADAYYKKKTGNDEKHIYVKPQKVKKDFKPNSVKKSKTEPVKTIKKEKKNLKKDISVKSKPINEPPKTEKSEKNIQFHNPKSHDESAIGEFVKLLENGYSQQNALKHVDINQAIINNWYMDKKSEFLEGYEDDLFVKYNELLIENAINSISENNGVGSNSGKLEFWIENFEEYIDDLSQDLTGEQLKVFQIVFKRNSPKKVKFDIEEHSQKNIPVESSIDEKELERRKQLMLDNIEKCNFNLALKKSRLDPYEIQKSKKEFLKTKRKNFYYGLSEKLMGMYLSSRRNGKSTEDFCREMQFDKFEVDFWIGNELFRDFQVRYNKSRVLLLKQAKDKNKNLNMTLNDLEMNNDEFNAFIRLINTDDKYVDVRQLIKPYFSEDYSKYSHEDFINEFKENPNVDAVLKKLNFRRKDLEACLDSNEKLHDEFMEIILDKIVKSKINNEKVNLKSLGLTQEEYFEIEDEINERIVDNQIRKITNGLSDGMLFVTANNVGCDMDTVFEWILKGSVGNNKFTELANKYWEIHIKYINSLNSNSKINLKISQNNLEIFGLNDHRNYWEKWGLINENNSALSIDDVKKILKKYLEEN